MLASLHLPLPLAASLALTIAAVCRETETRMMAGSLAICADQLIGGPGEVRDWLADLDLAVLAGDRFVVLPPRAPGVLQHVVYTLSAILVWAGELQDRDRPMIPIPDDALAAWASVETAVGLSGRTAAAMHSGPGGPQPATRASALIPR